MGRHRRNEDPNMIVRERRVAKTLSLPRFIVDALDECKNPSAVVTEILRENITRIGNLTVEDAMKSRENTIKEIILKVSHEVVDESFKPKILQVVGDSLKAFSYELDNGQD